MVTGLHIASPAVKTKRPGLVGPLERPTVPLRPIEVAALLHESQAEAERSAETVELLPLSDAVSETELEPEPPRLARGSESVPPAGQPVVHPTAGPPVAEADPQPIAAPASEPT